MDGIELVDSRNPPENAAICRCSDDPKPHVHYLCEIDRYVPADAGVGVHADVDAGLRTKDAAISHLQVCQVLGARGGTAAANHLAATDWGV